MYHFNNSTCWHAMEHGLRGSETLGKTKFASIFLPYIGNIKIVSDSSVGCSVMEDNNFQIVAMEDGYAIRAAEDTTDRIFLTADVRAHNRGCVRIVTGEEDGKTRTILAVDGTSNKKEAILLFACILEVGEQITIKRLEDNRPPSFITYFNRGFHSFDGTTLEKEDHRGQPWLHVEIVDGVEWYARKEAEALAESMEGQGRTPDESDSRFM